MGLQFTKVVTFQRHRSHPRFLNIFWKKELSSPGQYIPRDEEVSAPSPENEVGRLSEGCREKPSSIFKDGRRGEGEVSYIAV